MSNLFHVTELELLWNFFDASIDVPDYVHDLECTAESCDHDSRTAKQLVDAAPEHVRGTILTSHAESIKGQMAGQTLNQEEVTTLTSLVSGSSFTDDKKAMLLVQLSR